mmetsp:Transcript_60788/g.192875  ORF Transcript_60788/g.192875 Transcript_60788/m.192875 type:complete len:355 (+) Transcript_60788:146-1210(+)
MALNGSAYAGLVLTLVVVESLGQICVAASKVGGVMQYSHVSAVLLTEMTKLLVSVIGTTRAKLSEASASVRFEWKDNVKYAVPGMLYMIVNNAAFVIMQYIDPGTYGIMWNIKILYTALLLRVIMKKVLAWHQWAAIGVLILGLVVVGLGFSEPDGEVATGFPPPPAPAALGAALAAGDLGAGAAARADGAGGRVIGHIGEHVGHFGAHHHTPRRPAARLLSEAVQSSQRELDHLIGVADDTTAGMVLTLISASVVALANVFCEWLYKRNESHSIHWQNLQLYSYGVAWNMAVLEWRKLSEVGLFHGYNGWTVMTILLGSGSGLLISAVLKVPPFPSSRHPRGSPAPHGCPLNP